MSEIATIANGGAATVGLSNGICKTLYLGGSDSGTVEMTGGIFRSVSSEFVGYQGTGKFTQSGGSNTASSTLSLGFSSTGSGTYELSGTGTLLAVYGEKIGEFGTGRFIQSGGTNTMYYHGLRLGSGDTSNGTYELSGTGILNCSTQYVGDGGPGRFIHSGGTNMVKHLYVGYRQGGGHYELSDTGQLTATDEYVGGADMNPFFGPGTFDQRGGNNTTVSLILGFLAGSSGTYNLTGGTLVLSSLSCGSGAAAFNFGAGTLKASNDLSTSLPMTLTGTGGNATFDTAGYDVTCSGRLSGLGGLNKRSAGTLTLSAGNTYTGPTTVEGGILSINNPYLDDLASVSIAAGAKLDLNFSGSDTIGSLYFDGTPAPAGTWGATGSGAVHIDDVHFSGVGQLNVVPEPSIFVLLGMGVVGLLGFACRRRRV